MSGIIFDASIIPPDLAEYFEPADPNALKDVWNFPTQPFPQAHFAVFPEKLPELCIKAATPEVGCCSKCGAPWERIVNRQVDNPTPSKVYNADTDFITHGVGSYTLGQTEKLSRETLGWQATCKCNADKTASTVLDPFSGAGTTVWVAKKLNRKAIGFEISEEYCKLAVERTRQQVML